MSESRTLRDRQAAQNAAIDRLPSNGRSCAGCLLVKTTMVTAYPTSAAAYYACNPCQISGVAQEGAAATYVPDTYTIVFCWNDGSQVPPQGTVAVAHAVGGRYVFEYSG
jgi:hypothetical protein